MVRPTDKKRPETPKEKCICQICTCGRHRCPHSQPATAKWRHTDILGTEQMSLHDTYQTEKSLAYKAYSTATTERHHHHHHFTESSIHLEDHDACEMTSTTRSAYQGLQEGRQPSTGISHYQLDSHNVTECILDKDPNVNQYLVSTETFQAPPDANANLIDTARTVTTKTTAPGGGLFTTTTATGTVAGAAAAGAATAAGTAAVLGQTVSGEVVDSNLNLLKGQTKGRRDGQQTQTQR